MSTTALESFTIINPNPTSNSASSMTASLMRSHGYSLSIVGPRTNSIRPPLGLGSLRLQHPRRRSSQSLRHRSIFLFAASHEEPKPSEIDVQDEKSGIKVGSEESEEAWKQALESFKEQALKMQCVSQEAYEEYSKKAIVVLKETSEQLKIQAEKARQDLTVIAKEISEEGKEYLSTAAENSPEQVKDIVETFASSPDNLKDVSQVRDFYLGIPYGALLSVGGFLSFMLTGSTSGIRFGVILGGSLLALSISSLRSWKRGESSSLALKGQAAIASVLFFKDVRRLFVRSSSASPLTALISGAVVAFYIYRITVDGKQTNGQLEHGNEN